MTILSILETFLIGPLKLFFELVFSVAYEAVGNCGVSIICLSLVMNLLVLPLYKRADAMQEEARDTEARLHEGVAHIRKTFSGNERFLIQQTYYRQMGYSPASALRGSASLLLEIPFFMAAYQFLSHLGALSGVAFGPIRDLGAQDGLLQIAGVSVNLLPILMTAINIIAASIYLKGFPLKTKIQLYGMAAIFLVLLYRSPAGLVFYWTLNNLFSLGKNIVMRIAASRKARRAAEGAVEEEDEEVLPEEPAGKKRFFSRVFPPLSQTKPSAKRFAAAGLFMTMLVGVLIPSACIADSAQEFVNVLYFFHPLWYVLSSFLLAAGLFLLWFSVFYWLASPRGKVIFERVMWVLCGISAVNYFFFGRSLGILTNTLAYENGLWFTSAEMIINIAVLVLVAIAFLFVAGRWEKIMRPALAVMTAAFVLMSSINVVNAAGSVAEVRVQDNSMPHFPLSKDGKNVIVFFLDRGLGEDLPFLMNERPELAEMFDGFTYYDNCISYGGHTNIGAPPLLGGYEYTPVEMNKRDKELLEKKHNESLLVLPRLFSENGYKVTVCDPPYAGYQWNPDLSVFDKYPEIDTYITKGYFGTDEMRQRAIQDNLRNFYLFALMKTIPIGVQAGVYDYGQYHSVVGEAASTSQTCDTDHTARGYTETFMESYEVLVNLPVMTHVEEGNKNTYLFFYNDTPHTPMMLPEPSYTPAANVDNAAYDLAHADRFVLEDKQIDCRSWDQLRHYQSNMGSMLLIGQWLDYLKEQGVYDNTRIILAADHGFYLYQNPDFNFDKKNVRDMDVGQYFPLLMVKDFDAHGFETCHDFMTNADVPWMAAEGLIAEPRNPFTGNILDDSEKYAHDQFVSLSHNFSVEKNNGKTFTASRWAVITDNIWDRSDWEFIDSSRVLKKHEKP